MKFWPIPNTTNDTNYMLFISDSVGADDAKKEAVTYENALKNIGKLIYCIFSSPMNYNNDYFPYVVCLLSVQPHFQMTSESIGSVFIKFNVKPIWFRGMKMLKRSWLIDQDGCLPYTRELETLCQKTCILS